MTGGLRFLGFDLARPTPDENTIRAFRERLINAGAIKALFGEFENQLKGSGYLPMGGQIVDATLVSAPRQRNNDAEKKVIKQVGWRDMARKPSKARKASPERYRCALNT